MATLCTWALSFLAVTIFGVCVGRLSGSALVLQCTGYLAEEIPERISTASRYRCWLKNHVEPKWRDYPIEQIKPLLVEDWLKKLNLAPKSKSHLKNLMRVLF